MFLSYEFFLTYFIYIHIYIIGNLHTLIIQLKQVWVDKSLPIADCTIQSELSTDDNQVDGLGLVGLWVWASSYGPRVALHFD